MAATRSWRTHMAMHRQPLALPRHCAPGGSSALKPQDRRPVLWVRALGEVSEYGRLYGHGLARFGLTHDRLLTVSLSKPQAVLWTIEEALRSRAVSMVVCDANHTRFDLTATRRAMLAAQEGETPCLMVFASPRDGATAARTRWHVSPAPSIPPPYDDTSPGNPAWHLTLDPQPGRTARHLDRGLASCNASFLSGFPTCRSNG
jgi:protein ImuA